MPGGDPAGGAGHRGELFLGRIAAAHAVQVGKKDTVETVRFETPSVVFRHIEGSRTATETYGDAILVALRNGGVFRFLSTTATLVDR